MEVKLKGLKLYVHPKDQYQGKKKTWKPFHLQLTSEDEAEWKQDRFRAGLRLALLLMEQLCE
jgi:hypothetical protein